MSLMNPSRLYEDWMEFSVGYYINQGVMHRLGLKRFAEHADTAVIVLHQSKHPSATFLNCGEVTAIVDVVSFQQAELNIDRMCSAALDRITDLIDIAHDTEVAGIVYESAARTKEVMGEIDAAHGEIRRRMHSHMAHHFAPQFEYAVPCEQGKRPCPSPQSCQTPVDEKTSIQDAIFSFCVTLLIVWIVFVVSGYIVGVVR